MDRGRQGAVLEAEGQTSQLIRRVAEPQTRDQEREKSVISEPGKANWHNASSGVWTGRVLSGLFIIFMLGASAFPKFFMPSISVPAMEQLGWPSKYLLPIGVIEVAGTLLYLVPRTAVIGAILLTGLLGGVTATHLRIDDPLFGSTLFGLYLGLFMWGGLWMRDASLRALLSWSR